MKVVDPGHIYQLACLDGGPRLTHTLRFVKRKGPKYPGNHNAYSGTTMQEVLRACIDRTRYVNHQQPCKENEWVIDSLRRAIQYLERRAARVHGRTLRVPAKRIEDYPTCPVCLHIQCKEHRVL